MSLFIWRNLPGIPEKNRSGSPGCIHPVLSQHSRTALLPGKMTSPAGFISQPLEQLFPQIPDDDGYAR
jgi:hypothetical protein